MEHKSEMANTIVQKIYVETKTAYLESQNRLNAITNKLDKLQDMTVNILTNSKSCTPMMNYESSIKSSENSKLTSMNSEISETENSSKVVVQVLPQLQFGNISAMFGNCSVSGFSNTSSVFKQSSTSSVFKQSSTSSVFKQSYTIGVRSLGRLPSQESIVEEGSPWEEESMGDPEDFSDHNSIFSDDDNYFPDVTESQVDSLKNKEMLKSPIKKEEKSSDATKEAACKSVVGDFVIYPGNGLRLSEFSHVVSELKCAQSQVIRILHYFLYGVYGYTGNEHLLHQTRKNILLFSGFDFDKSSVIYQKKQNSLTNLPYPLLLAIYKVLIKDSKPLTRSDTVETLLEFLLKPDKSSEEDYFKEEEITDEIDDLRKKALEANPVIKLERLADSYIEQMVQPEKLGGQNSANTRRAAIRLKHFPEIVINVERSRRRIINLLHSLLFGRPGSDDNNRLNILEFGGFKFCQKAFVARRLSFLNRLKLSELLQLCNVFTLRAKSGNKSKKVKKLLSFLQDPGAFHNNKKCVTNGVVSKKAMHHCSEASGSKIKDESSNSDSGISSIKDIEASEVASSVILPLKWKRVVKTRKSGITAGRKDVFIYPEKNRHVCLRSVNQVRQYCKEKGIKFNLEYMTRLLTLKAQEEDGSAEEQIPQDITPKKVHQQQLEESVSDTLKKDNIKSQTIRLRDFERICKNVECASPDHLVELNDLMYITPCDNSEIHEKILDFTSFSFNINSHEYHYRKTLTNYMTPKSIMKIAQILDIDNCDNYASAQDLATVILKFLMDLKLPDKKKKAASDLKNKQRPHILKLNSHKNKNFSLSRSQTPEPLDSTYGSEEINDNEGHKNNSSHSNHESIPYSRYRHRKTGLSAKQESILNDSTPLADFMHHPTDSELHMQIETVMESAPVSVTMGGLVREVLSCYPNFNLHYRIDFIKTQALQILQDLRQNAIIFPD